MNDIIGARRVLANIQGQDASKITNMLKDFGGDFAKGVLEIAENCRDLGRLEGLAIGRKIGFREGINVGAEIGFLQGVKAGLEKGIKTGRFQGFVGGVAVGVIGIGGGYLIVKHQKSKQNLVTGTENMNDCENSASENDTDNIAAGE